MRKEILPHVVLSIGLAFGIASTSVRGASERWLKIDAGDFVVYTDSSQEAASKVTLRYAAYRVAFRKLLLAPDLDLPPSVLILFRRASDLYAHCPEANSRTFTIYNHSIDVDGTSVNAFSHTGDLDRTVATTLEFETTWLLRRMNYLVPIWMSQGAGKVLATTSAKDGRWLVGTKREAAFRRSWTDLFWISQNSPAYSGPANADYHNQIWALMHWVLFKDGETQRRFVDLAVRLNADSPENVLPEIMGLPLKDFRKEIDRHWRQWKPWEVPFDEAAFRARLVITPAPPAEVLVQKSDLLAAAGKIERANENLDQARTLAPKLALVQEAWGRRMVRERRLDLAVGAYREAIAAGSQNFLAYLLSGAEHLQEAESLAIRSTRWAGKGGSAATVAVKELREAIRHNNWNEEAFRQFGQALYYAPEVSAADVDLLRKGIKPGARGVPLRMQLARVLSRVDRTAEGVVILQEIIDDPTLTKQSESDARRYLAEITAAEQ